MSPNSLIFLVIIGIWAAYLTKYWMRRRDHLATARSMDRFSEAMRVLQSSHLPRTDVAPARPTSYALAPEKLARPQVTVKRATAAAPFEEIEEPMPAVRRRFSRGFRGVTLLVTLALIPTVVVMALLAVAPWWGVPVVLANVVAAFLWLRQAVQEDIAVRRWEREQSRAHAEPGEPEVVRSPLAARGTRTADDVEAARRARRAQELAVSVLAGELPPEPASREEVRAQSAVTQSAVTQSALAGADEVAPGADRVVPAAPAALAPPTPVAPQPAVPNVDEDDIPLTWDPRPVPAPTYTLKARAEHAQPQPLEVPQPEPIPAVSFEDDGVQAYGSRTAAG